MKTQHTVPPEGFVLFSKHYDVLIERGWGTVGGGWLLYAQIRKAVSQRLGQSLRTNSEAPRPSLIVSASKSHYGSNWQVLEARTREAN